MEHAFTNNLINSTSPYLLQHAHNPVDWQPWSKEIIQEAQKENKLVLVSIGYAACHWCHVMEHESFEDTEVAEVMNKNFVCIKVDREERPDVDHYYMTAVQLMQQRGGWPLNVIALPDGRPIWGGTYFPKENWVKSILSVTDYYSKNKKETEEYAAKLQEGIQQMSLTTPIQDPVESSTELLTEGVENWKKRLDLRLGGSSGAPKFPMPVNLDFLLYYGFMKNDQDRLDYVETTLQQMGRGGIYDQIGGGFARYSVDEKWKVPHFEKMLYDNAQLLSLYSKGYQLFQKEEYKSLVYETAAFLERELMDPSGAFYSSLDADSEGEEGKFYVWTANELQEILEEESKLFFEYYNVNSKGFWEHGKNILLRIESDESFASKNNLTAEQLNSKVSNWKTILLNERQKRVRPGLDDKTLTSWNALLIQGLVDAYKAFQDKQFLDLALVNAGFLSKNVLDDKGKLFHNWKKGKANVDGFLEDYSLFIQACLSLFEVTGDEQWINRAGKITAYVFNHFYNEEVGLFYFSEYKKDAIVSNHFQKEDNVLPAANSVMANNLYRLYLMMGRPQYLDVVKNMLPHITPSFEKYPMAYANWGTLMLKHTDSYFEVVVAGDKAKQKSREMQKEYLPQVLWAFTDAESQIPLLKNRLRAEKTLFYVCRGGTCLLPVETAGEALNIITQDEE